MNSLRHREFVAPLVKYYDDGNIVRVQGFADLLINSGLILDLPSQVNRYGVESRLNYLNDRVSEAAVRGRDEELSAALELIEYVKMLADI